MYNNKIMILLIFIEKKKCKVKNVGFLYYKIKNKIKHML